MIDLGAVRDPPVLPGRSLASRLERWRTAAVLGAAAAVLATAVAASPVRVALLEQTFPGVPARTDQPIVAASADGLYLVRARGAQAGPGERTVIRYGVAGAVPAWQVSVLTSGAVYGANVVEGTLLLHTGEFQPQTIALRAADGRFLWRRSGSWVQAGAGELLLSSRAPGGRMDTYQAVALTTGQARWAMSVPSGEWVLPDRSRLVRWSDRGRAEVRDVRTGAVVSSGTLSRGENGAAPGSAPGVQVAGGLLLVAGWAGDRPVATAYGLDRLDRRWQADIDLSSEAVDGCGAELCVSGRKGRSGVRMLERDTGRTRWADDRWEQLSYAGSTLLGFGKAPGPAQIAVLDANSGRQIADLGRWETSRSIAPDGRMLGVRTEPGTSRTWIAELDPAAWTTRVLGVARDAVGCQAGPAAVTCRRTGGAIGVWYPRRFAA
ncbi:hypothetical protein Prum_021460 [Phytohabitans rumicis]|uniref:Uncharacterized protein n=1 Tax=Phytohabitans rumicis TaxID=1076125 RepID=A0A6V8KXD3_9ACTN|nr:hypothetical protein Prum_021460 [Phytohabitans rumicis]